MSNEASSSPLRDYQKKWLQLFIHETHIAGLTIWLAGGWAVEALDREQQPRDHGDIDFFIFRSHSPVFHTRLNRKKFHGLEEQYNGFATRRITPFGKLIVCFTYLDLTTDSKLVTFLPEHTVNWPVSALPGDLLGELDGKPVPCFDWNMAYAETEVRAFIKPDAPKSPDLAVIHKQVKPATRKAISKGLIVEYQPA